MTNVTIGRLSRYPYHNLCCCDLVNICQTVSYLCLSHGGLTIASYVTYCSGIFSEFMLDKGVIWIETR